MERKLVQFRDFFARYRGETIYVGFSGGADSTALLLLLDRYAEEFNLTIEAVHFDHGIRNNSAEDARWCGNFCADRLIRFQTVVLNVPRRILPGESVEAAARRCRLEAWRELAPRGALIAVGHQRGDRVENALLRLCRGSNVSGLTSLRYRQVLNEMIFLRPLLDWTKAEIEKYLQSIQIKFWREDATNQDLTYKRNLFRQAILPRIYQELSYAEGGMMRSLEALEQDASFIEEAADRQWRRVCGRKYLPADFIREQHQAILFRILRLWLSRETGRDTIPDYSLVNRIIAAARRTDGEARIIPFRRDLQLEMFNGRLTVYRPAEPPKFGVIEWNWQQQEEISYGPHLLRAEILDTVPEPMTEPDRFIACFPLAALPEVLAVRAWQEGDRMVPAGRKSAVKLKKLFADLKIPAREKRHYPVLLAPSGEVLWVAGIRRAAVSADAAAPVIRLSFRLHPEPNPPTEL